MRRTDRNRAVLSAVGLALAVHALVAVALAWLPHNRPPRHDDPPRSMVDVEVRSRPSLARTVEPVAPAPVALTSVRRSPRRRSPRAPTAEADASTPEETSTFEEPTAIEAEVATPTSGLAVLRNDSRTRPAPSLGPTRPETSSDETSPQLPVQCEDPFQGLWTGHLRTHATSANGVETPGTYRFRMRVERQRDQTVIRLDAEFHGDAFRADACDAGDAAQLAFGLAWAPHGNWSDGRHMTFVGASVPTPTSRCGARAQDLEPAGSVRGDIEVLADGQIDASWHDARRVFTHIGLVRAQCLQ